MIVERESGLHLENHTVLYSIDSEVNDDFGSVPLYLADMPDFNKHFSPADPMMGINQQIRDLPGLVVKDEIGDMTDIAITGINVIAFDLT